MPAIKTVSFGLISLIATSSAHGSFGGAVSPKAYELFTIPGTDVFVTNSIVTTWVISIILIVVVRSMVGKFSLIPSASQAIVECMIEGVKNVISPIVGKKMVKPTFPLLICLFTFILINNWSALFPGVGTFGIWDDHGHLTYFFRPANADLNTTAALAIISTLAWLYFIFRYAGIKLIYFDLFGNKADKASLPAPMYIGLTVLFFAVGLIEVFSIVFRPVSLSFRLFGNVFGGENLISNMHGLFAYALPVPFYMLEVLIGFVQAFVFTLLVAVYIGLICNHGDGDHAH